jgi:acyl-CoA thioesterase I
MKNYKSFVLIITLTTLIFSAYAQDHHIRFGFIGNSITFGANLTNPKTECYSAQLDPMLQETMGDTVTIGNYAISSRTMLKHGDYPIWNDVEFRNCWKFAPNILLICLGTNDSKPQNWDRFGNEFYDDYKSMIDTFRVRNPYTLFMVCYPPPAYQIVWGIRDSVIVNSVMPAVDSIVAYSGATLVDFYHPLIDSVSLFPDYIHPNHRGQSAMARILYNTIMESDILHKVENGLTFVSDLETDTRALAVGDSATLSWTTINADSATLNGLPVQTNGSCKVSPAETTVYTLVAMGQKKNDSLQIEQLVYEPFLQRLGISPRNTKVYSGDTVNLKLSYIDQMNKTIPDVDYNVTWAIVDGDGKLTNQGSHAADFIAGNAGKAMVEAGVDTLFIRASITIQPVTTIQTVDHDNTLSVYPNPADNLIHISFVNKAPTVLDIRFFDLAGNLVKKEIYNVPSGEQTVTVKTKDLKPGNYIYKIEYGQNQNSGKIAIRTNH